MSTRQIQAVFDDYQKARAEFVQTVAELSSRPQNVAILQNSDVLKLLRPLLLDKVVGIQQSAALALGRLANSSANLAESIVAGDILPHVVYSMQNQNKFYKKSAALILRAVSKHSPELAQAVVDVGGLEGLQACLETFDPSVKESALWTFSVIAKQTPELAMAVVDCGAVPTIVLCVNEADLPVRRTAASAIGEICKHSPTIAQMLTATGAIPNLCKSLSSPDAKLKRHVLAALSQIAKHNVDLAELVVEGDTFPGILKDLKHPDEHVRRNVTILIREIVKHSYDLAQLVVNTGALVGLVDYMGDNPAHAQLPAIQALGYISSMSDVLASAVIKSKAVLQLEMTLGRLTADDVDLAGSTAWTLGQIGRHSTEHTNAVSEGDNLFRLVHLAVGEGNDPSLRDKAETALKLILSKCTQLDALMALLTDAPPHILEHVVVQFSKVLPKDASARKVFISTGGLKKINSIVCKPGSMSEHAIREIKNCFPPDIVQFYSPDYTDTILERVQNFKPEHTRV